MAWATSGAAKEPWPQTGTEVIYLLFSHSIPPISNPCMFYHSLPTISKSQELMSQSYAKTEP